MSETMRAVYASAIDRVETVDSEIPQPGPGEARLRTVLAGICGSDTHAVAGHHGLLRPPYYPGHEAVCVVDSLGPDVAGPPPGTRVILKPNVTCGECVNCRADRSNACETLQWIGCDTSGRLRGAMAEYLLAPVGNLFPVPGEVTDAQAVLVECLATPVHAARIAGDLAGARVLVIGGGTIGFFSLLAARRAGAGTVVLSDLDAAKRDRASRHGADAVVDPAAEDVAASVREACGGPVDVVFDCVTNEASMRTAVAAVRHSGTVLVVGVPSGDVTVPLALIQDWELRVQGCANYTGADIETAIEIARAGGLPAQEVVSASFGLDEAAQAFAQAASFASGKVVLHPAETR